jgi:hypothetical protein
MEAVSLRAAARLVGRHPRTIQRAVAGGRLQRLPDGRIAVEALQQAGYQVGPEPHQRPAHRGDTSRLALLQQEREHLRRALDQARRREDRLLTLLEHALEHAASPPPRPPTSRRNAQSSPEAVPLLERIRQFLVDSSRPRRAWQIRKRLSLERSPYPDLSRLVQRGDAVRLAPGLYTAGRDEAVPSRSASSWPIEPRKERQT